MGSSISPPEITPEAQEPVKIPISRVKNQAHIPSSSFEMNTSYLSFFCNSICKAHIKTWFFVYENGLGFTQDSTKPLPSQDFEIPEGFNNRIVVRLNHAYIDEYIYEPSYCFPIVIELLTEKLLEITMLEIRLNKPRVIQQRVIINNLMYEI